MPRERAHTRLMESLTLKVNGQTHTVTVDPATPLLYVLGDDLGLRGPHFGCGMAQCGACTVIMGDHVVRSCVKPVGAVGPEEITTLEGLGTPEKPHPLQQAFIEEGAAQCGFCLSGVILTAKAALFMGQATRPGTAGRLTLSISSSLHSQRTRESRTAAFSRYERCAGERFGH